MIKTKHMVWMGILIAVSIVLSRFLFFSAWNVKIGFAFIPIVIGAVFFGPVQGGIAAAAAGFLGAILFPIGMYFLGFTVTVFLTGLICGVLLHKNRPTFRIACAVLIVQLVYGPLLSTCWISLLYGVPYLAPLSTKIVQYVVLIPVQFVIIARMYVLGSKKYHILQENS